MLDLPPKATANAWLDVTGAAEGATTVTVNGAAARLEAGRFAGTASLVPGTNGIEIVATDAVGNVAIKRVETMYDIDPPEIVSAAVTRPGGAGGPIEILVEARDASGLRQASPLRPERRRRPSARLPALRRRDRALPRDAAAGAGAAGAGGSHGRGLRGQCGEAERVRGGKCMRRLAGIGVLLALTAPASAQVQPAPAPLLVV